MPTAQEAKACTELGQRVSTAKMTKTESAQNSLCIAEGMPILQIFFSISGSAGKRAFREGASFDFLRK
ncbi:MAG: hypothetical protein BWY75_01938 [bacterium ADurb.Bin425]|nr:MAG: hypothetical protein BWY75_01938 [bacterium ADurb.Bin425]